MIQLPTPSQERAFFSPEFGAPTGVFEGHDDLTEQLTPAELHNLTKKDWGNYQYKAAYQQLALENALSGRGAMTHDSFMDNFHNTRSLDLYEPSLPQKYEGYYIDQKRKQDEAVDFLPALYTHKTFQSVFDDDEKPRLNPIDVVFQDGKDLKSGRKSFRPSKRLYKNVQRKLAREKYVNYDYFKEQQRERTSEMAQKKSSRLDKHKGADSSDNVDRSLMEYQNTPVEETESRPKKGSGLLSKLRRKAPITERPESKEVFTDQVEPDDDDSIDEDLEAWMAEQPGSAAATSPTFRKQIKKKWRKAKRTLEDNYFENYKREIANRESKKHRQKPEPHRQKPEPQLPESPAVQAQPAFNPIWNSILSWVVYTPVEEHTDSGKIEEISDQSSPREDEGRIARRFKQKLIQGWSRPASLYSRADDWRSQSGSRELAESPRASDGDSKWEIEVADNAGSSEYLYQNPETSALEQFNSATLQGLSVARSVPIQVVSHINKLIKSVRIMKILFSPIDIIAEQIPSLQSTVIVLELIIFVWILYEVSLLIDALCMAVRAVCAPMIAIGKFMNRVV